MQTIIRNPLEQFEIIDLFSISTPLLGYKFALTNLGLYALIATSLILTVGFWIASENKKSLLYNYGSLIQESAYATIHSTVKDQIGSSNEKYLPFIFSLCAPSEALTQIGILVSTYTTNINCMPRVNTTCRSNKLQVWVAVNKWISGIGLPLFDSDLSGIGYGEANELDTQRLHHKRGYILSRICRYIVGSISNSPGPMVMVSTIVKISVHNNGHGDSLSANSHVNIDGNIARAPKSELSSEDTPSSNTGDEQPRDVTAYEGRSSYDPRRTRNSRSRGVKSSKGSSSVSSSSVDNVSDSPSLAGKPKPNKAGRPPALSTLLRKEMDSWKSKDGRFNGIIKTLSNRDFLIRNSVGMFRSKPGNLTPGPDDAPTLCGSVLNLTWFQNIADKVRNGTFTFSPAKRVLIQKPGKKEYRPLGAPQIFDFGQDKIVQKALQSVLEAIWEKSFTDSSHGYRPKGSCHTALKNLNIRGSNFTWVIQGDLSECFDRIPHDVIMSRINKKIKCQRTLELIRNFLNAGYIDPEDGTVKRPNIGIPQGSVLSPLLCHIVLHDLDLFMDRIKQRFEKGSREQPEGPSAFKGPAAPNGGLDRWEITTRNSLRPPTGGMITKLSGADSYTRRQQSSRRLKEPHKLDMHDPYFKRIFYVRYADGFVILIAGSKNEAHMIRSQVKDFLKKSCGLELNLDKTVISHLTKDGFNFLGAQCFKANMTRAAAVCRGDIASANHPGRSPSGQSPTPSRRAHTRLIAQVPILLLLNKLLAKGFLKRNHLNRFIATSRRDLVNHSHQDILQLYNSITRDILNNNRYLAVNYSSSSPSSRGGATNPGDPGGPLGVGSRSGVIGLLKMSCALTLALKYKLRTARSTFSQFGPQLRDPDSLLEFTDSLPPKILK
jgi:group II intron reverse transcriptase/maturase